MDQIENGVGMVSSLLHDFQKLSKQTNTDGLRINLKADIVCGELIAPLLEDLIKWINSLPGIQLNLIPVENRFFGNSVTVTGLLTGSDILEEYKKKEAADTIIIPDVMLKQDEQVFLDDYTIADIERQLGKKILTFDSTISGLWDLLTDQK
jgi:NifB/MoaA-like Fe-S oxidoreductase